MGRDIRAIVNLKQGHFFMDLLILFGMGLLMTVIAFLLVKDGATSTLEMRQIILIGTICGYLGGNVFFRIFFLADEAPKGLSFGMTRKKLFIGRRIYDFLELGIISLVLTIVFREYNPSLIFKTAVVVFGIYMWSEGLAGNNVVRYGKIVYWIYYAVMMIVCIGGPRLSTLLPSAVPPLVQVLDYFTNPFFNQGIVWGILLAFAGLGTLVNWLTFRTLAVRFAA